MDEWMELHHRGRNNYTKPQYVFLNDEEILFLFCDKVFGVFFLPISKICPESQHQKVHTAVLLKCLVYQRYTQWCSYHLLHHLITYGHLARTYFVFHILTHWEFHFSTCKTIVVKARLTQILIL